MSGPLGRKIQFHDGRALAEVLDCTKLLEQTFSRIKKPLALNDAVPQNFDELSDNVKNMALEVLCFYLFPIVSFFLCIQKLIVIFRCLFFRIRHF
ncbi:hypothetical protein CAEBREN_05206 [Caenorhabditis brenneri]|uniref:Uncharacterized protein n=1 Tax=Caenorhabditis brenneri TaxID=135651 RepID=G0MW35_CAEBE|nr:hypothetical protein CAEBREN_05206 [Caenorhabditis brenneri]